jgi:L-Ala-D/L-Glu epimerase
MKEAISSDRKKKNLILNYWPYELQLKHVFTIASGSRTTTPVVLTSIEYEGIKGFGEASMPPYLGESHKTVMDFLSKVDLSEFSDPLQLREILDYVNGLSPGNYAAKASVDIALHDLAGKLKNEPCYEMFHLDPLRTPHTSLTIGIDNPDIVRQKVKEAENFRILKIKVGEGNEKEMVNSVRSVCDKPLFVDVNRGWSDKYYALDMTNWLKERNVCLIEQPFPESRIDDIAWLVQNSPLPIIADEGIKTLEDLNRWNGLYSGVNIKLMKCGGMDQAFKMIQAARSMKMKVMIGCMTETSCAVSAAAQLSPAVDWADLDGNILITNDIYEGMIILDGKISLNDKPGIGVIEKN